MSEEKNTTEQTVEIKSPSRSIKPLVFISHDTRDAELAEAFSKLLSSVSAGVLKSFRSSDKSGNQGIAYGVEWYPEIMKRLDNASDVVALLTQNSVDRPWILYEAGVAKGKLDTPLLGVAIGIPLNKANNGPFAQFQNSGDDIESLTKLVVQLVNRIPNSEPDKEVIRMQVEAFKKQADGIIAKQPKVEAKDDLMEDSSVAQLFEEIKIMFQDIPSRIDKGMDFSSKRRRRRFHPGMFEELFFLAKEEGEDYWTFLMMISFYKEDMPWIYDIGKETYEIVKSTKSNVIKEKAINSFRHLIKRTSHHPMFMEMMGSKEQMIMLEELSYFTEKYLSRLLDKKD